MKRIVPIKGYEKEYMISDDGIVFRIENDSLRVVKSNTDKDGYLRICLCKGNEKKSFLVHRLVAEMFIVKPCESFTVVNHKDENKKNNTDENLEWCTVSYNNSYNNGQLRRGKSRRKPVVAFKNGQYIHFDSITEASKVLGTKHSNILRSIKNEGRTAKGYSFYYR